MKKLIEKDFVTKKIAPLALCAATLLSIGGVNTYAAGNYYDTGFSFTFENMQARTSTRSKLDSTSSYMYCQTMPSGRSYTAHVVALSSKNSKKYIDVSRGHTYKFVKGRRHKMVNFVRESGFSYAAIAANPDYANKFSATGVWSPDSI